MIQRTQQHKQCACHGGGQSKGVASTRMGDVDPVTGSVFTPPVTPDPVLPGTYANGYDDPYAPGGALNAALPGPNSTSAVNWTVVAMVGLGALLLFESSGGGRRR
ncbi:MAG: hypothetical protein M3N93_11145 [Acidobacteriota bacterium]|nr:hypothetical protein [Acidobacteriota bacterium]